MSGNDNIERELESFLREDDSRVAALYRKLPRVEPDAKLDAAVLAMARGAVATKRVRSRWMPALSAAAVVLFTAGLAYRVGPQVWNDRGELTKPSATQSVMKKKASPPAESAASPQAESAPVPSPARDAEAFPAVKTAKQKSAPEPQPAVAGLARQKTAEGKIAPKPAPAPAVMEEMRADRISGGAAPTPASPPPSAQSTPLQSLDATIFPGKEQEKSEADANRAASLKDKSAEVRSETALTTMSDAPAQPPSAAPARAVSAPAPSASAAADPNIRLYPESWVANIQKMLRENHREDAIKSLGEFRKKYPSYRLPDDLRDLK